MNVGVNYLREHMLPDARVHYVITRGGLAANVVPDLAESFYMVRSPQMPQAKELFERVQQVAQGAALMTGTTVEVIRDVGFSNLVKSDSVSRVLQDKLLSTPMPQYTPEELDFARAIRQTVNKAAILDAARLYGQAGAKMVAARIDQPLFDAVLPLEDLDVTMPGSTDVGDVSWVVPTSQISTVCGALGTPGHSWQQAAHGGMSIGHKGLLYAGKVMATAALEFMHHPKLVAEAKAEFRQRMQDQVYESPIPEGVNPPA